MEECEFEFQQEGLSFPDVNGLTTVADRIEELMSEEFDKGSGAGIKVSHGFMKEQPCNCKK